MLSNATVKAARARARPYKIFDERGLHLHVAPSGRLTWRVKYRWQGREQLLTIGCYPDVSLTDARVQCDAVHGALKRGAKPCRSAPARAITFAEAAGHWIALQAPGWTAVHAADVESSLARDVFPAIGALELRAIAARDVLALLREVEGRGALETARRLRQRIAGVFALGRSEGWCEDTHDPAAPVAGALRPILSRGRQPAIVDVAELVQLGADVDALVAPMAAKLASRFLALTAARFDAVRGARWGEIDDLDGPAPVWRVPAARVKLRAAKKRLAENDHLVPLSAAAVAVLRAARANMHSCDANMHLIFTTVSAGKMIAEGALRALYDRAGYAGRHVPHGWRAAFSTIMNERRPGDRVAIDRALGHALRGEDGKAAKVEGAYNRAVHLDLRRELLEEWGALIAPYPRG